MSTPTSPVYRQYQFTVPPGATDVLLVRHGESAPVRPGESFPLTDGHTDPPLAPEGEEQAERLGQRLALERVDAIYVSTLRRTHQTAAPLATRLGLTPVVVPDLREVHLGEWEDGLFRRHTADGHPTAARVFAEERWDVIPGAESSEALTERVVRGLSGVVAAHPDERVVVVAHAGVICALMNHAAGTSGFTFVGADNGSISQLVVHGDRWIIRRFNDTAHLQPYFSTTSEPLV